MAIDWYSLPPPVTLGEIYLQPTGKNQRSRARTRRRWLSAKPVRDWAGILPDILSLIFSKLTSFAILWPVQAVCRSWRQVSLQPHIWHRIDLRDNPEPLDHSDIEKLTREAVERSRGGVEELYCGDCGSDYILAYITNQCPLLEDVRISYYSHPAELCDYDYLSEIFGNMAQWCPKLKRIRLVRRFCYRLCSYSSNFNPEFNPECGIDRAEIINNMPHLSCHKESRFNSYAPNMINNMTQLRELRELQLINNRTTNKGLLALLDKCPHLDLLDIRLCRNIRLDAEMKARLERIKIVRLPHDPIKEYEFCKTDMIYDDYSSSNWSFLNFAGYNDSDGGYMYDDYYSPYDEFGDEYDFCIS